MRRSDPKLWQVIVDSLSRFPDDQKVSMLEAIEIRSKLDGDLEALRAIKEYRLHQEELRQAIQDNLAK